MWEGVRDSERESVRVSERMRERGENSSLHSLCGREPECVRECARE